jgi:hypothetical protein
MNEERRQQLLAKYQEQFNASPDPNNPHARACIEAERLVDRYSDEPLYNRILSDPAHCPALHAKVTRELAELHALERENGGAIYKTFRFERYDPHDPKTTAGAKLLKFPGDRRLFVCRSRADRLAAAFEHNGDLGVCDVCIATDCQAKVFIDHPVRPLPISCGRVVLVFEICLACEWEVCDTVLYNIRASVMDRREDLPPDAVIDPGSPIPPQL